MSKFEKSADYKPMTNNQIYEKITDKMIGLIESGKMDWRKPWKAIGMPCNYQSKRPYSGYNLLATMYSGFESPYYLTMNQINTMKGNVKKGSKGTLIAFWKFKNIVSIKNENGEKTEVTKNIPLLRTYYVFNAEQIDGIEFKKPEEFAHNTIEDAEEIIKNMPNKPAIEMKNIDRACYSPSFDKVTMPKMESFPELAQYYSTFFHELGHSTGHASRLKRDGIEKLSFFGSHSYSFEELVAELCASFICGTIGIANENSNNNSAAYLQSWLKTFKADKTMFFKAASKAQKAADYILGKLEEKIEEVEKTEEVETV